MNEPMKLAIEGREALVKYMEDLEKVFSEIPDDDTESSGSLSGLYGAIEEALTIQDSIIEQLATEVSDGRVVGDVIERIVELNEEAEIFLLRVEHINKKIQKHQDELTRLFTGATNG